VNAIKYPHRDRCPDRGIFLIAQFPVILFTVPVAVLFSGLTEEPYYTHIIWYGMMNALGIFQMDLLV
jgi:hypothetical protein